VTRGPRGRVVAFDLGAKRIGVAVSDPTGSIAEGRETIVTSGGSVPWKRVLEVVTEAGAERVVVGDPVCLDGTLGEGSRRARDFREQLERRAGVRVELFDERFTSVEARRSLRMTGRSRKREKADVDRAAATLLLQSWLDRRAARGGP
jgi:putative Holliday junction resolvase